MGKSQISLLKLPAITSRFGGSYLKSHPKTSRPLSKKHPMHVVLKSDVARGRFSMLYCARRIETLVQLQARQHGIKILSFVNVGNHLHLILQLGHRNALQGFLRSLCGIIAKEFRSRAKCMGTSIKNIQNFWQGRPFSRVINGFRDLLGTQQYLFLNELEVFGVSKSQGKELLAGIRQSLAPN